MHIVFTLPCLLLHSFLYTNVETKANILNLMYTSMGATNTCPLGVHGVDTTHYVLQSTHTYIDNMNA